MYAMWTLVWPMEDELISKKEKLGLRKELGEEKTRSTERDRLTESTADDTESRNAIYDAMGELYESMAEEDYRLSFKNSALPINYHDYVCELIQYCRKADPSARPSFSEIRKWWSTSAQTSGVTDLNQEPKVI